MTPYVRFCYFWATCWILLACGLLAKYGIIMDHPEVRLFSVLILASIGFSLIGLFKDTK